TGSSSARCAVSTTSRSTATWASSGGAPATYSTNEPQISTGSAARASRARSASARVSPPSGAKSSAIRCGHPPPPPSLPPPPPPCHRRPRPLAGGQHHLHPGSGQAGQVGAGAGEQVGQAAPDLRQRPGHRGGQQPGGHVPGAVELGERDRLGLVPLGEGEGQRRAGVPGYGGAARRRDPPPA